MSLTLGTIITASRDRHPSFSRERCPDAPLARYLTDVQNELLVAAAIRDRQFMAQTAVVSIAIDSASAPGTAGAGTSGGVPGIVNEDDTFSTSESSTGSLIEVGVTEAEGATVLIADAPITSATSTTLTKTGAGRTVNGDVDNVLVITAGKGLGQRRVVLSNTATVWTVDAWDTTPDSTSLFSLVAPVYLSDDTAGAVTALPSTTTNQGYLVKLDASGNPYIDYTEPLTASVEQGVPLPSMASLLPGLCQLWRVGATEPEALMVTNARERFSRVNAVYVVGSTLYLCGTSDDWSDVQSLELRYLPIAPAFTALTDLFLLPDHARPVLVAKAASFIAMRVEGMEGVNLDSSKHALEAQRAQQDFFRAVLLNTRGRGPNRVRADW